MKLIFLIRHFSALKLQPALPTAMIIILSVQVFTDESHNDKLQWIQLSEILFYESKVYPHKE